MCFNYKPATSDIHLDLDSSNIPLAELLWTNYQDVAIPLGHRPQLNSLLIIYNVLFH